MLCRVVYFLIARKTLDLASTEIKWYIGVSLFLFLIILLLIILTGETPLRYGGKATFESRPFMFIFTIIKTLVITALFAYAFTKVMRCKSWVVKIRK